MLDYFWFCMMIDLTESTWQRLCPPPGHKLPTSTGRSSVLM